MDGELSVTLGQVLSWSPCYDVETLRNLAAGRERITAREILDLPIPAEDRLWALLREELIPAPILHEFACRCAETALNRERERGREPDPRSWKAIEIKRSWLRGGASDADLVAAWYEARYAASDAASDAAWHTAWYAAWYAAGYAAGYAAWDAAWYAASDATRNDQIEILRSLLTPPVPAESAS